MSQTRRGLLAIAVILVAVTSESCVSLHAPSFTMSASQRDWPETLTAATTEARAGHFGVADSLLAHYAANYPNTDEALETTYWRAIFAMDPTNSRASLPKAIASLDLYLGDRRPRTHVTEAMVIRHVAGQLDALNTLAANAVAQAKDASTTAATAKAQAADATARAEAKADGAQSADGEIKRLKDELAKANAELDRIRKRLTQTPAKPPG